MKRIIFIVMYLFYVVASMSAQLSIGGQRMLDLQEKISGEFFTVDEMYTRYGKPQRIEVEAAQIVFPYADPESKITWYYYDDMGEFLFYYNASSKNEFLMQVTVINRKFIKELGVPEDKENFKEYFGEGNDMGMGIINYGYNEGYLNFNFTFENDILIEIQIGTGDW